MTEHEEMVKAIRGYKFVYCDILEDSHDFRPWLDWKNRKDPINYLICRECGYTIEYFEFDDRLTIMNKWNKFDNENQEVYDSVREKVAAMDNLTFD